MQFSLMHLIKRLQGSQISYQKKQTSVFPCCKAQAQSFTSITGEIQDKNITFALKCSNIKKKKFSPKTKSDLHP